MLQDRVDVGARAVGARVLRAEDPRILTGRGRYVDDIVVPGCPARGVPAEPDPPRHDCVPSTSQRPRQLPGVVAVYTGEDMARLTQPAQAGSSIGMTP